ncbi:phage major capsid protein [Lutimaribacter marinistellae]|uniref:Phage major capsid protein n=1 Tax=Lutimaribacter marinistellae TaxID=1820329 RepID=A0ABV7TFR3_9RHOB
MFIPEKNDLAARKNCMDFFRDKGITSLYDIQPYTMRWADLQATKKRLARDAREILDKIDKNTPAERALDIENAFDGMMNLRYAIEEECDIRTEIGSREPREHELPPHIQNKRPIGSTITASAVDGGEIEGADTLFTALKPNERFKTWATAQDGGYSRYKGLSLGRYLRAMVTGPETELERRALSEGTDSAGGYTTPVELSAQLIDATRAASVCVRAGARTVPLTSDSNVIARVASDPVPAWRLEAGAVAESDPTFDAVTLAPKSLAVRMRISHELMQDSLNLETELPRVVAAVMAAELDRVCLLGSGSAPEPRGVANTSGIGTTAVGSALTSYGNLVTARTGILSANCGPLTAFVMHPRDEGTFTGLTATDDQPLMAPKAVAEIPWLTTTSIPTDGGSGSDESTIIAGNFNRLLIGIRQEIRVEVLKLGSWATNLQYDLIAHMRADVAVEQAGAFYTLTGVQG